MLIVFLKYLVYFIEEIPFIVKPFLKVEEVHCAEWSSEFSSHYVQLYAIASQKTFYVS